MEPKPSERDYKGEFQELVEDLIHPKPDDDGLLIAGREVLSQIFEEALPSVSNAFEMIAQLDSPDFIPPEDPGVFDPKKKLPRDSWEVGTTGDIRTLRDIEYLFQRAGREFPGIPTDRITAKHINFILEEMRHEYYLHAVEMHDAFQRQAERFDKINRAVDAKIVEGGKTWIRNADGSEEIL